MTTRQPSKQPSKVVLPETLARRVAFLREQLDLTPKRLADKAGITREMIEEIESGLLLFLAPSIRQRLARVLRVRADVLQEVEQPAPPQQTPEYSKEELIEAVLQNPTRVYFCPECGATLKARLFERRDHENQPLVAVKINCTQCLFQLDWD